MTKSYDFLSTERKWREYWQEKNIYKWDKTASRESSFVVDTPPPTVSGQLHMGHIFSYTQADFIIRYWRMRGKNVYYPIGFDDNGLPTERLVEKQRKIRATQTDRAEFIQICQEVVVSEEEKFRDLFKNIALSVDWSLEYQTISKRSRTLSQMSFLDLVKKGEIYRENQPILWDPIDQTALAQADIEDKEFDSSMNDIKFACTTGESLTIATTRPELLPACVAVFYNPEDKRYQHLQGQFAITPLFGVKVPILADSAVSIEKGTGLVMCCTFGDNTDVIWWKTHKLPLRVIINKYGKINPISFDDNCTNIKIAESYAKELVGLKVKEAREVILKLLAEQQLLLKQEPIKHTVKCAERSGAPLEIIITPQWFVRTLKHRDALLERARKINWHPRSMKIRLDNWINSLAWDWCISRQRFFGVPFPVWYSKRQGEEGKALFADLDQLPVDPLTTLPKGYSREEIEPDLDVMDTWATSAITPQLNSYGIADGFMLDEERHSKLFPADLRPQAHEILRTWAFYTILKGHLHQQQIPWKNIMISGWCLAEDKTKMSKSKGNVVTPESLLSQYSADVVRYWAATSKLGADTAYSEEVLKNGKKLVTKLWNAANFAAIHLQGHSDYGASLEADVQAKRITNTADLWIISRLTQVVSTATKELADFEYAAAREVIERFFWYDFCDNYLELVKTRVYNESGTNEVGHTSGRLTLYWLLKILLKLFAPFIPFITEELDANIYQTGSSIHSRGSWPELSKDLVNNASLAQGELVLAIINIVRRAKAERNLSVKAVITELCYDAPIQLNEDFCSDLKDITTSTKLVTTKLINGEFIHEKNLKVRLAF